LTTLDFQDFALIIGMTTLLTIGAVTPTMYKFKSHICDEIMELRVRMGIEEKRDG